MGLARTAAPYFNVVYLSALTVRNDGGCAPKEAGMSTLTTHSKRLLSSLSLGLLVLGLTAIPAAGRAVRPTPLLRAPVPCNQSAGRCCKPAVKARWQYQLQGSPGLHGGCRYARTGFVNIGV